MGANRPKLTFSRVQGIDLANGSSKFGYILGGDNREDLYRFKLGQRSSIDITLDLLKTDVNLQLFNSNQRLIQASTQRGSASEEIVTDLKSGTYFLRIYTKSRSFTRYQLKLSTDWADISSRDGDSSGSGSNGDDWGSNDWNNNDGWNNDLGGNTIDTWDNLNGNAAISDGSLSDPTLNDPPASIALTSPNGGNMITSGSRYAITWQSNTSSLIKIELLEGDALLRTIAGVSNSGNYFWAVPVELTPASDYRIRISIVSNPEVVDVSDQFFSIKK